MFYSKTSVLVVQISIFYLAGKLEGGIASELPPPAAAVFLYDEEPLSLEQSVNKTLLNDIINSDVEIENGRGVLLECFANNPVQWNYHGPGRPVFTTSIKVDALNNREVYKATLQISKANEKDTGLYSCSYTEFPKVVSSYHLFIPGSEIFVSDSGRTIRFSRDMPTVIIPCPTSVKSAKITLRKVYFDGSLRIIDGPIAIFDPKIGFKLSVKDLRDSDGVYVCTGYLNGSIKLREFTLRNEVRNQTSVTFPDGLQEDVNPCISYSCPIRSVCRVNLNTNLPFCACRKGHITPISSCTRLCKTSQECPKSEKCQFSIEKQLKMCVHVCEDHKCAEYADCYADDQTGLPKCRCRRGFMGNGKVMCERIPVKPENETNSYCSSAKCGANARCQSVNGKSHCVCSLGTLGVWPNCSRACIMDTDCGFQDRCNAESGICEHVCTENMCAPKAECKVLHRKPMCLCTPGFTGKATEACYPSHYYFNSRSGLPADAEDLLPLSSTTTDDIFGEPVSVTEEDEEESKSFKLSLPTEDDGS